MLGSNLKMNFDHIKHYFWNVLGVWEISQIVVITCSSLPSLSLSYKILTRSSTHTLFNIRSTLTVTNLSSQMLIFPSFAILFAISGVFGPCLLYFHFQVFSHNHEEDLDAEDKKWRSDCSRLLEFRQIL